jgi:hypothetical protein
LFCSRKVFRRNEPTIRRKKQTLHAYNGEWLLLHDKSRPHIANKTNETLRHFKWEALEHPPYSPDLAPSGPLQRHLSAEHFPHDEAVEREVIAWFRSGPKNFQGLVQRRDKCLNVQGDYVEK